MPPPAILVFIVDTSGDNLVSPPTILLEKINMFNLKL